MQLRKLGNEVDIGLHNLYSAVHDLPYIDNILVQLRVVILDHVDRTDVAIWIYIEMIITLCL